MVTKTWKVYGYDRHKLSESFYPSCDYDFSNEKCGTRKISIQNSDKTGTNEYAIISITRDTSAEVDKEFEGQLTDGCFENSNVGSIIRIYNRNYTSANMDTLVKGGDMK